MNRLLLIDEQFYLFNTTVVTPSNQTVLDKGTFWPQTNGKFSSNLE